MKKQETTKCHYPTAIWLTPYTGLGLGSQIYEILLCNDKNIESIDA